MIDENVIIHPDVEKLSKPKPAKKESDYVGLVAIIVAGISVSTMAVLAFDLHSIAKSLARIADVLTHGG